MHAAEVDVQVMGLAGKAQFTHPGEAAVVERGQQICLALRDDLGDGTVCPATAGDRHARPCQPAGHDLVQELRLR